jgi:hypothetical protein
MQREGRQDFWIKRKAFDRGGVSIMAQATATTLLKSTSRGGETSLPAARALAGPQHGWEVRQRLGWDGADLDKC